MALWCTGILPSIHTTVAQGTLFMLLLVLLPLGIAFYLLLYGK